MPRYAVVIPAAGKSERFEHAESKIFAKIDGRPMFLRTLERFVTRDDVCQTILAVSPGDMETVKGKFGPNLAFMGVKLIEGGDSRSASVAAALEALSDDAEYVAVHDAARPCVTDAWIDEVFAEATRSGGALLVTPVVDTLKRVSDAKIVEETISREGLYAAQTPQVFRVDIIKDAYAKFADRLAEFSDDAMVVEAFGHAVSVVISDASNLKVTSRGDVSLAAAIIKSRPIKKVPKLGAFDEAQW